MIDCTVIKECECDYLDALCVCIPRRFCKGCASREVQRKLYEATEASMKRERERMKKVRP